MLQFFDLRCYLDEAQDCSSNSSQICSDDFIVDCSGLHCCDQSRIGDGTCDNGLGRFPETSSCDLTCYAVHDGGDCDCPEETLPDCSGDHTCVSKTYLGDGHCDDSSRDRGFDLVCYNEDDNDCTVSIECPVFESRDVLFDAVSQWIDLGNNAESEHPCGNINEWDVSKIRDMSKMFCSDTNMGCLLNRESFNGDISSWNVSSVTNFSMTFDRALEFNGNLNSWDTSSALTMRMMFRSANSFEGTGIENFDISSVTDIGMMFYANSVIQGGVEDWDTRNVQYFDYVFAAA